MGKKIVLASRGDGARCYRIPALTVLASGRLFAAWDARPDVDDLPAEIDLVYRTSDDLGQTWSPTRVLRSHQGNRGFGDASLLVDKTNGRLFCFHTSTFAGGFFDPVTSGGVGVQVELGISDDEGETWRFVTLTEHFLQLGFQAAFAASGNGIQLSSGRLLQCFVVRKQVLGKTRIGVVVGFSDDSGETWGFSSPLGFDQGEPAANESKVVQEPTGRVVLCSRAAPNRLLAESWDQGQTFSSLVPAADLIDPSDNGGFVVWGNRLACSHNHDSQLRCRTVVSLSSDGGVTWPTLIPVELGSSGYSTAVELPDGNLALLYERGAYTQIVFETFSNPDPREIPKSQLPGPARFEIIPTMLADARSLSQCGVNVSFGEQQVAENVRTETAVRHFGKFGAGVPIGLPRETLVEGDLICVAIRVNAKLSDQATIFGDFGVKTLSEATKTATGYVWTDLVRKVTAEDIADTQTPVWKAKLVDGELVVEAELTWGNNLGKSSFLS